MCSVLWTTHGGLIISVSLMIWILWWILWSEFSYVLCQPCQTGLFMRSAFASQCYYDGASGQGESASQSQRLRGKPWVQCIGNVYMYMQMRVSNFCGLLSQHGFFWVLCASYVGLLNIACHSFMYKKVTVYLQECLFVIGKTLYCLPVTTRNTTKRNIPILF